MPFLVRIKDGLTYGCAMRPGGTLKGGTVYVASDDEARSFSDKFVILDDGQVLDFVSNTTIDRILALAENDSEKAAFLSEVESFGKKRSTLIDKLDAIVKVQ